MQVSVESQGNLGRRVTLSLPADRLQSLVDTRLKDIQKNANIKGFRPGKVPANVINQRFGDQVRGEAIEGLLREGLTTAIRDNDFNLAGNPSITPVEGSELDYIADIELMPEFGDVDVTALNVTRNTAEVTDADIDTMINNLQQQRRTWKPVERGAQEGDLVGFESFSTVDGTRYPEEGFERNATAIGSNVILPELEEGLKGFEVTIWHGLYAPKGTPADILKKVNDALKVALKDPEFIKKSENLSAVVATDQRITPEGHKAFVQAEIAKWSPIIKAAGTFAD